MDAVLLTTLCGQTTVAHGCATRVVVQFAIHFAAQYLVTYYATWMLTFTQNIFESHYAQTYLVRTTDTAPGPGRWVL